MPEPRFDYPAMPVTLPTIPASTRAVNHQRIRNQLAKAASGIENFNPRILRNEAVTGDLLWLVDAFERIIAIQPEGFDRFRDLPAVAGIASDAQLIRRVAQRLAPSLFHPLLPDELFRTPPKLPEWAGSRQIRNPFLEELDDDECAKRDRIFLEKMRPDLADFLKIEAQGGPSYESFFQAEADLALAKEARSYSGPNPFIPLAPGSEDFGGVDLNRQIAIGLLFRTNRLLAEQLKREAESARWNPFPASIGGQMILFKADIALCYLCDAAARFETAQLDAELREAEAANKRAMEAASEARAKAHRERNRPGHIG